MGHNSGTHKPSDPVPKHQNIVRRGTRWYYRRRIPVDLVEAGVYGKKKDIKRSLGTPDLATANSLAITVALEVDEDFECKRRELAAKAGIATDSKPAPLRRLEHLTELERKNFILRAFIELEKRASETRREETDSEDSEELLGIIRGDLGDYQRTDTESMGSWRRRLMTELTRANLSVVGASDELLDELAEKLRRAFLEATWRTEQTLSGNLHMTQDPLFKDTSDTTLLRQLHTPSKGVGDLCADYRVHTERRVREGKLAPTSLSKMRVQCRIMTEFLGEGKALEAITNEDAAALVDFLPTIPVNAAKRYPGLPLKEAVKREEKAKEKKLVSAKTVEHYHTGLSAMLTHAMERGWLKSNPLKSRLIRELLPPIVDQDREQLTPEEMTTVFSCHDFLRQRTGAKGTLAVRFWLPLLCLFHGARANEIAGLRVADVSRDQGVDFLHVRESADRGLKTKCSERKIPLHKELIKIGFLDFVTRRRKEDPEGLLFAGLRPNKNGSLADGIGKWWGRLVERKLGESNSDGPKGGRGIHSFRHSWVLAARSSGMDESIRRRLGGWISSDVADEYGWDQSLELLKEAIDKVEFPGFPDAATIDPD